MVNLLRHYWFAGLSTLSLWAVVLFYGGFYALFTVVVLTLLEITFSADNAVVNSKILVTMSRFWQQLFLTVGIVLAVFVVRFILPIVIVMFGAGLGFSAVLDLALNHPEEYAHHLEHATPVISTFGGVFLLLIALSYFIDYEKKTHWLSWIERHLGRLGQFDGFTTFVMLMASIALYMTVDQSLQSTALFAAICAMGLHSGLRLMDAFFTKAGRLAGKTIKTGVAGFVAFMYLQAVDASFSLDGVIGAFAITSDVLLIAVGLGAGAVWVRAMTLHMVRAHTLKKYAYLEQGAHWAIAFLGSIMLLHLYGIALPEWVVGSLGIVVITAAVAWSVRANRLTKA